MRRTLALALAGLALACGTAPAAPPADAALDAATDDADARSEASAPLDGGPGGEGGALAFVQMPQGADDYASITSLPPTFGKGELTFSFWIRPDATLPVGAPAEGSPEQLRDWVSFDPAPYSSSDWWYRGNFLLDGHNNASFSAGTFSLQLFGGGRLRWLFGDGGPAGPGGVWAVQRHPAASATPLLDGAWHHAACVRRWAGASAAELELWLDGKLEAKTSVPGRTDMQTYWSTWSSFPTDQHGWFFGAEKQAAIGVLGQYEDYKGLLDELAFFDRALTPTELATTDLAAYSGSEPGLVALFSMKEGSGTKACDTKLPTRCITLHRSVAATWSTLGAPP